jgi:hypothetical protein
VPRIAVKLLGPILLVTILVGCGNSRTAAPSLTRPALPRGFIKVSYWRAGISFRAPRNWTVTYGQSQPLLTVSSGSAVVAVWRYERPGRVSSIDTALAQARDALISKERATDPGLQVIRSQLVTLAGAPAVILDADEQIASRQRRVRSIHLFASGAEVVIDEYAPLGVFDVVDHAVFSPLKRSLALIAPSAA